MEQFPFVERAKVKAIVVMLIPSPPGGISLAKLKQLDKILSDQRIALIIGQFGLETIKPGGKLCKESICEFYSGRNLLLLNFQLNEINWAERLVGCFNKISYEIDNR